MHEIQVFSSLTCSTKEKKGHPFKKEKKTYMYNIFALKKEVNLIQKCALS